jgi:hypothetical protein
LITQSDDGQDFDPDDPLTVILRPTPDYLGLPPGRYERIRRGAARRRHLRIAVGVGLSGAVAALIVLPLRMGGPGAPAAPAVPLGPPPAPTSSSPAPPAPAPVRPTQSATPRSTGTPVGTAVPTPTARSARPTPTSVAPSQTVEPPTAHPDARSRP